MTTAATIPEIEDKLTPLLSEHERKRMIDLINRRFDAAVDWDKIVPLQPSEITDFNKLPDPSNSDIVEALKKVAIVCFLFLFLSFFFTCLPPPFTLTPGKTQRRSRYQYGPYHSKVNNRCERKEEFPPTYL